MRITALATVHCDQRGEVTAECNCRTGCAPVSLVPVRSVTADVVGDRAERLGSRYGPHVGLRGQRRHNGCRIVRAWLLRCHTRGIHRQLRAGSMHDCRTCRWRLVRSRTLFMLHRRDGPWSIVKPCTWASGPQVTFGLGTTWTVSSRTGSRLTSSSRVNSLMFASGSLVTLGPVRCRTQAAWAAVRRCCVMRLVIAAISVRRVARMAAFFGWRRRRGPASVSCWEIHRRGNRGRSPRWGWCRRTPACTPHSRRRAPVSYPGWTRRSALC